MKELLMQMVLRVFYIGGYPFWGSQRKDRNEFALQKVRKGSCLIGQGTPYRHMVDGLFDPWGVCGPVLITSVQGGEPGDATCPACRRVIRKALKKVQQEVKFND